MRGGSVIDRAVQDRLALMAHLQSGEINIDAWWRAGLEHGTVPRSTDRPPEVATLWFEMAGGVATAPLVVVDSDFCLLIESATLGIPDEGLALQPDDFFTPTAFVWCEEPVPVAAGRSPLAAVLWLVGPEGGYRLWPFVRDGDALVMTPGVVWLLFGEFATDLSRVPAAVPLLLNERVATRETTRCSRPVMRRAARANLDADIHIVRLRRAAAQTSGAERTVEWSQRWVVRGHWRNQWYPSKREHRSKWIPAHIKGPDDKPFNPRGRVYVADR